MERLLDHTTHAVGARWASMFPPPVTDVWWTRGEVDKTYAFLRMADWPRAAPQLAWYAAVDPQLRRSKQAAREAVERALAVVATEGAATLERVLVMVPERGPRQLEAVLEALRGTSHEEAWRQLLRPDASPLTLDALEALFDQDWRWSSPLVMAAAARRSPDAAPALLARAWGSGLDEQMRTAWGYGLDEETQDALVLVAHACNLPGASEGAMARQISLAQRLGTPGDVQPRLTPTLTDAGLIASAVVAGARATEAQAALLRQAQVTAQDRYIEGEITWRERAELDYANALCEGDAAVEALLARDAAEALERTRMFAASFQDSHRSLVTRDRLQIPVNRLLATATLRPADSDSLGDSNAWQSLLKLLVRAGSEGSHELVSATVERLEAAFGPLHRLRAWGRPIPLMTDALSFCPGRSRELEEELDHDQGEHSLRRRARVLAGLWRDGELAFARFVMEPVLSAPVGSIPRELVAELVLAAGRHRPALLEQAKQAASDALEQLSGPEPALAWRPAARVTVSVQPSPERAAPEPGADREALNRRAEQAVLEAARVVFGDDREFEAHFNEQQNRADLFVCLEVVDEVTRPRREVALGALQQKNLDAMPGEELLFQVFWHRADASLAAQQDREVSELIGLKQSGSALGRIEALVTGEAKRRR